MRQRGPATHRQSVPAPVRRAYIALVPHRRLINVLADAIVWSAALVAATFLRYDFSLHRVTWSGLLLMLPVVIACQFVFGMADGLYLGRWAFGSFEEVASLLRTVLATGTVLFITNQLANSPTHPVP